MKKKLPIEYEKTFYHSTFFDNSIKNGKDTGDYSGSLLVKTFTIKNYSSGPRVLQKTDVIEFGGKNREEMLEDLERKIDGLSELKSEESGFVPKEVEKKLQELKSEKSSMKKKTTGDSINLIVSAVENTKQKTIDKIHSRLQEMSPSDVQHLARIMKITF